MTIAQGNTNDLGQALEQRRDQSPAVGRTLQDEIRDLTPQLAAAIPPGVMTPERFVRVVLTVLRKNQDLMSCNRESFLGSMMTAAQLGLEVDPALGQAYLVPYKRECTLQIGYKGYIELAARGGILMESREVRENDDFDFDLGSEPYLHHKWKLGDDRGAIIGYYGKATFRDGRPKFHIMDLADIEKRKNRSQVRSDKGPWKTDPEAMSRKTVIRAMIPQIPLTTELGRALEVDEGIIHMKGSGNLEVKHIDPADAEVGAGEVAAKTPWRVDAEEELEALMHEAKTFQEAQTWLLREHGPIPTLSDDRLSEAITGIKAWLDGPVEPQASSGGQTTQMGAQEPLIDVQAHSEVTNALGEDDRLIGSTTVTVMGMKADKVRETLGLFLPEGYGALPDGVGQQRTLLIEVLVEARRLGNKAAADLF